MELLGLGDELGLALAQAVYFLKQNDYSEVQLALLDEPSLAVVDDDGWA